MKKEYSRKIVSRIGNTLSKLKDIKERYGTDAVIAGFEKDWYKYETGIEDLVKSLERLHQTMSVYMVEREKPGMFQNKLRDQAVTDTLTELPNRFALSEVVRELIRQGEKFVFVAIDINDFKQ